MPTSSQARLPAPRWLMAQAMLTVALLLLAWWFNGVGAVGVMADPDPGPGRYLRSERLAPGEQIDFARVDRAISRLRLGEDGRAEQFEAYGDVLHALSNALSFQADGIHRANHLLRASLPEGAAQDLAGVLTDFLAYRHLEQSLLELSPGGPGTAEGAWVQLRFQEALRRSVLGQDVANRLYGTTHRMTEMHLVQQLVMQRDDLDEAGKQRLIRQHREALVAGQDNPEGQ
ncbi:lipase secretion chaperone [Marinobacter sp.]|uniref:lipase secretion chaperone n=1 Tax=Marinobacter sp. TaxID=50741 RepID=UPI003564EE35